MKKFQFSLIEMITVIVVILILLTLAIPNFNSIRKKAKTIVCANQLKHLGVLLSTYANDNDGRLPYSRNSPYYSSGSYSYLDKRTGPLYGSWTGHLIPYFDIKLTTWSRGAFYHDRSARGGSSFAENTDDIYKPPAAVANENYQNWRLLHNMYYEGGHGDLKIFICPDAVNTYDANVLNKNRFIPRISGILPPGSGRGLYGLPSSYLANGQLFSISGSQSRRLEDVSKSNYLLLEGCDHFSQDMPGVMTPNSYSKFFGISAVYGGHVNNVVNGWGPSTQSPTASPRNMAASFFHDDTKEVWFSWRSGLGTSYISRYNKVFYPYAIGSYMWDRPEGKTCTLVTNRYPGEKWQNFELPFTKGKYSIYRYYSEDQKPTFMFGKMNLLMADLSINKAHMGWMFENARILGVDIQ